jgi:hypothetical protein
MPIVKQLMIRRATSASEHLLNLQR